jgi:small subunit ribosomal protein S20
LREPLPPEGCYHRPARWSGHFHAMPNIRQQEKRVRQAARQRAENLRWRSTAKTLMRRLREAVDEGDSTVVAQRHTELERWLDRASAHGALHKNTAARRKAQASRVVAGERDASSVS